MRMSDCSGFEREEEVKEVFKIAYLNAHKYSIMCVYKHYVKCLQTVCEGEGLKD